MFTRTLLLALLVCYGWGAAWLSAQSEWSLHISAGYTYGADKQSEYSGSITEAATGTGGISLRRTLDLGDQLRLIGDIGYEITRQFMSAYSGGRIGGSWIEGTFPLDRLSLWWAPEIRLGSKRRRGWVAVGPVGSMLTNNATVPVSYRTWLIRNPIGPDPTLENTSRTALSLRNKHFRTFGWGLAAHLGWRQPLGTAVLLNVAIGYERGMSDFSTDAFSRAKWHPQQLSLNLGLILAGSKAGK